MICCQTATASLTPAHISEYSSPGSCCTLQLSCSALQIQDSGSAPVVQAIKILSTPAKETKWVFRTYSKAGCLGRALNKRQCEENIFFIVLVHDTTYDGTAQVMNYFYITIRHLRNCLKLDPLLCSHCYLSKTFHIHIAREQGDIQSLGDFQSNLKDMGK